MGSNEIAGLRALCPNFQPKNNGPKVRHDFHFLAHFATHTEAERTFGDYTVPSRLHASWWAGTDREFEFFRTEVDSIAAVLKQHKVVGCAEIKHNLAARTDFASMFDRPLMPIGYSRIAAISAKRLVWLVKSE